MLKKHFYLRLNVADNGQLMGASGVEVLGSLYDVEFVDGSCNSLFSGCTDFMFTTADEAAQASLALIEQVLLDSPVGNFDSVPYLTNGMYPSRGSWGRLYLDWAIIETPYARSEHWYHGTVVSVSWVRNWWGTQIDEFGDGYQALDYDTTRSGRSAYAAWDEASSTPTPTPEPVTAPVPEPGTIVLLSSGLIGMGIARRKFKGR
jgi:hypothetical protein